MDCNGKLCMVLAFLALYALLFAATINCEATDRGVDWDAFYDLKTDEELDPGSWHPIYDPDSFADPYETASAEYYLGVLKMVTAVRSSSITLMEEAVDAVEAAAEAGNPHALSVMGFLYGLGQMRERNGIKSFVCHSLAAEGGNMQSKMALAYMYELQHRYDDAIKLYTELAEATMSSFLVSYAPPTRHPRLIHKGDQEDTETINLYRGENRQQFRTSLSQAKNGNPAEMYTIGLYYYSGLGCVRRDRREALRWFLRAAEKGQRLAMALLGEIYIRGDGVERNYTAAFEWFKLASEGFYSATYGLGYLYTNGYGVEKNQTKAKECFTKQACKYYFGNDRGYYKGLMYLNGIGVERDLKKAASYLNSAASLGEVRASFQLAKMYHHGLFVKQNHTMAISLYKKVAEQGPWSAIARWAMAAYVKGDIAEAFFLYSRLAELGYENAQSNALWILERYKEFEHICLGESGFCTDTERHQRMHSMWSNKESDISSW